MTHNPATRPCWVVLAPDRLFGLKRRIHAFWRETVATFDGRDEPCPWEIAPGRSGYVGILEYAPGSECVRDEGLARALSKGMKQPAYVLWLNEDAPRVQAFVDGEYAGEIAAWPDDVAQLLGCSFPTMRGGGQVDLTPQLPPGARPGELRIAGLTPAQWLFHMKTASDWAVLLDGASKQSVAEAIAGLDHADATVRRLSCRLVGALGPSGLGDDAARAVERLAAHAAEDPDALVRELAGERAPELREALEAAAIRRELPWLSSDDGEHAAEALQALGDPRPAVRIEVCLWWAVRRALPEALRAEAVARLADLAASEGDAVTREAAAQALEAVRG